MKDPQINKVSDQIVKQTRSKNLTTFFKLLDSDNDGQISSDKVDKQAIPSEIQNVLKPLFDELEELGEPLDEEEFVDAANRLYEVSFAISND